MEELEKFLGIYLVRLAKESRRFVRTKSLAALVYGVHAAHAVAVKLFLALFGMVLMGSAIFALIIQLLNQYNFLGRVFWDPVVTVCAVILAVGLATITWSLRERRWLRAIGVGEELDDIYYRQQFASRQSSASSEWHDPKLRSLLDEIVAGRLRQTAEEARARRAANQENLSA